MQIPVIVEPTQSGQFRAQGLPPFAAVAEGPTKDAALANLRDTLARQFQGDRQLVMLDVPGVEINPWIAMTGWLKDDPYFDEWQAAIEENRRQSDLDAGIELGERA